MLLRKNRFLVEMYIKLQVDESARCSLYHHIVINGNDF
jgi:hypothetical protein